jgi:hypothetical protein
MPRRQAPISDTSASRPSLRAAGPGCNNDLFDTAPDERRHHWLVAFGGGWRFSVGADAHDALLLPEQVQNFRGLLGEADDAAGSFGELGHGRRPPRGEPWTMPFGPTAPASIGEAGPSRGNGDFSHLGGQRGLGRCAF